MKYSLMIVIVFLGVVAKTSAMKEGKNLIKISRRASAPTTTPRNIKGSTSDAIVKKDDIPKDFRRKSVTFIPSSKTTEQTLSS